MKQQVRDKYIPLVAIASPVLCFILQKNSEAWFGGYQFSYELPVSYTHLDVYKRQGGDGDEGFYLPEICRTSPDSRTNQTK